VPVMVAVLVRLNRQYEAESAELEKDARAAAEAPILRRHVVLVLVDRLDLSAARAIQYARTLTPDELRALVKRQLQVEAYVQERFAPLVFISNEEIQAYYRGTWSEQRRKRGLAMPPLAEVREEIRALLRASRLDEEIEKWTTQLRERANVDVYAWR